MWSIPVGLKGSCWRFSTVLYYRQMPEGLASSCCFCQGLAAAFHLPECRVFTINVWRTRDEWWNCTNSGVYVMDITRWAAFNSPSHCHLHHQHLADVAPLLCHCGHSDHQGPGTPVIGWWGCGYGRSCPKPAETLVRAGWRPDLFSGEDQVFKSLVNGLLCECVCSHDLNLKSFTTSGYRSPFHRLRWQHFAWHSSVIWIEVLGSQTN